MKAVQNSSVTRLENQYTQEVTLQAHREKKAKRQLRKRMLKIIVAGCLMLGFLAVQLFNSKQRAAELAEMKVDAQAELEQVLTHQEDLEYYVGLLEDENYVAKLARNEYYLSEENELIFTFPQDTAPSFSYEQGVEETRDDDSAENNPE